MKFGKVIEGELVEEWASTYFDYKKAKKIIGAIQKNPGEGLPKQLSEASFLSSADSTNYYGKTIQSLSEFLDQQLAKIQSFFEKLTNEAGERLDMIYDQIHIYEKLKDKKKEKEDVTHTIKQKYPSRVRQYFKSLTTNFQPVFRIPARKGVPTDAYTPDVSYRKLKSKLKVVMMEFYDYLKLILQYQSLNEQAFRKIIKKYDKIFHTQLQTRWMNYLSNFSFTNTAITGQWQTRIEDAFANVFTKGDRKLALEQLRSLRHKQDYSFNTMRFGLLYGAGIPLAIEGICYYNGDEQHRYLLQVWGGFLLLILVFVLFSLDCYYWEKTRVNYILIFEFNQRETLNWRQHMEIYSLMFFIFSLFFWLCMRDFFPGFTNYFPALFLGVAGVICIFPRFLPYWRSRKYFLLQLIRVFLSGFSSVHFQDFFFADQMVSLIYVAGNVSLFFCLYSRHWNEPHLCNSSNSPLLGFFTTLPAILRIFQCFRRYADSLQMFPHLVNALKYMFTVCTQMLLSLYRRKVGLKYRICYTIFAGINAMFSYTWDITMDWSLFIRKDDRWEFRKHRLLKRIWPYALAMIFNFVIRIAFIFYTIFPNHIQHSSGISFFITLSELFRRCLWNVLRVENEEIYNRENLRAARELKIDFIRSPADRFPQPVSGRETQASDDDDSGDEPIDAHTNMDMSYDPRSEMGLEE
ncbi:SPX/EXS domain protein [Schizosaccharomyces osmophilus]|uniref:SPX/EXS domain protein n=1 Tax=Schizosaccharomyces osmophilus TaxID=2545709 RepID=A0AAF0AZ03_9SCHI|nr:SPX/EXS domain protein [Schizosaccharomyces osmophilus]WBW74913.1 SPX/EXS domain protein [Schizosaccharomyces osmophilus]